MMSFGRSNAKVQFYFNHPEKMEQISKFCKEIEEKEMKEEERRAEAETEWLMEMREAMTDWWDIGYVRWSYGVILMHFLQKVNKKP
jgi:hypothetical protein